MRKTTGLALTMGLIAAFAAAPRVSAAEVQASLYERLGGITAIRAVVDNFANRIFADDRVNVWFYEPSTNPARAAAYKAKLADFICQATGGPCEFKGRDLETAHQGLGVTKEAFAAVVEDLTATLEALKVPAAERDELLGMLAPLEPKIVGH